MNFPAVNSLNESIDLVPFLSVIRDESAAIKFGKTSLRSFRFLNTLPDVEFSLAAGD
jgi:hypothetical protein